MEPPRGADATETAGTCFTTDSADVTVLDAEGDGEPLDVAPGAPQAARASSADRTRSIAATRDGVHRELASRASMAGPPFGKEAPGGQVAWSCTWPPPLGGLVSPVYADARSAASVQCDDWRSPLPPSWIVITTIAPQPLRNPRAASRSPLTTSAMLVPFVGDWLSRESAASAGILPAPLHRVAGRDSGGTAARSTPVESPDHLTLREPSGEAPEVVRASARSMPTAARRCAGTHAPAGRWRSSWAVGRIDALAASRSSLWAGETVRPGTLGPKPCFARFSQGAP